MDKENQAIDRTPVDLFLEDIGLSEYSELMKENDITEVKILSELSEPDFEKIGISSLGHRKKILSSLREELNQDEIYSPVPNQAELAPSYEDKKKGGGGVWVVVGVLLAIVLIIIIVGAM